MANLIADLLAKASPMGQAMQQASGMVQQLQQGTPAGMLSQADPRIGQVMNYIRGTGMSAKDAFYAMARQKGADPDQVIAMTRSMMNQK